MSGRSFCLSARELHCEVYVRNSFEKSSLLNLCDVELTPDMSMVSPLKPSL